MRLFASIAPLASILAGIASAQQLLERVRAAQPSFVDTLRQLVEIESPSNDRAGLDKIAAFLRERFTALGATVEFHEAGPDAVKLQGNPAQLGKAVTARFTGTGSARILLLAHMDTVHPRGTLARRPFRVEAGRAYGPGIADDKGGIALILHALALLRDSGFRGYGQLTVLISGDEEISTPGTRGLIARLAAEHDTVLSCEPGSKDQMVLATVGTGGAVLTVHGKRAHAGVNPADGRNALLELAYQLLQSKDLAVPERGLLFNWTVAHAGTVRNAIPDRATAEADVRVQTLADYDAIDERFRAAVSRSQLIPGTRVEARFERRRPPLEATDGGRALYRKAIAIFSEIGIGMPYSEKRIGASDAAFAGQSGKAAVLEAFGPIGYGFHSPDEEYVELDSIVPRLYVLARMIAEASK